MKYNSSLNECLLTFVYIYIFPNIKTLVNNIEYMFYNK